MPEMALAHVTRHTETTMFGLIRTRYTQTSQGVGDRYVIARHVRASSGFHQRTADAVVIDTWSSTGNAIHGFEIKVSRSDWLTELRDPEKWWAVGQACDYWWLVVPDDTIVFPGELPAGWGLLVVSGSELRKKTQARRMTDPVRTPGFIAAFARAVAKTERAAGNARLAATRPTPNPEDQP